eukprot:6204653-Pleurochrysis_carterae.AAC.1
MRARACRRDVYQGGEVKGARATLHMRAARAECRAAATWGIAARNCPPSWGRCSSRSHLMHKTGTRVRGRSFGAEGGVLARSVHGRVCACARERTPR